MVKVKKHKHIIYFIILILFTGYLRVGQEKMENIEELDIAVGIGYSVSQDVHEDIKYIIPINSIIYQENGVNVSTIRTGRASTIALTREERQRKSDRKFFLGTERVYIIDESSARLGVNNAIETLFKHPEVNDDGFWVICNGKSEDYFKYKVQGYDTPSEYIANMIKNASSYNFFQKSYRIKDVYLMVGSEGRSLVLPYIELKEKGFQITGTAIFKNDKLVSVLDIEDSKTMNMLRANKSKGMLTIQGNEKDFISYYAKCKRKVKCTKEGSKYKFIIDLSFKGDVVNNVMYKKLTSKVEVKEKFEKDMAKKVEGRCNEFIDKMKNQYKIDCLELGRVAAAKYGRDTGVDWNEVVSNSDIKVNVKVKVDKVGRGEY